MNRNDFNRFIGGGAVPGDSDLEGVRELTDLFPWFHSSHLVLLRGLRETSDIKFESQLKGSALFVADRSMLYHYLFMNVPAGAETVREVTGAVPEVVGAVPEVAEAVPEVAEVVPVAVPEKIEEVPPAEPVLIEEMPPAEPVLIEKVPPTEPVLIEEVEEGEQVGDSSGPEPEPEQMPEQLPEPVVEILQPEPQSRPEPEPAVEIPEPEQMPEPETGNAAEVAWEQSRPEQSQEEFMQERPHEEEPFREEPRQEEPYHEDTSLKTRDQLIAEIEARLSEIEKEDLLELAEGDEITVAPADEEGPVEVQETEEISDDSVPDVVPELNYTEAAAPEAEKQLSPNDLIDRFIRTSPRIERLIPGEVPLLKD